MSTSEVNDDLKHSLYIKVKSIIEQGKRAESDSEISVSKVDLITLMRMMFERIDQAHAELTSAHDIASKFSAFGDRTFTYGQFIELVTSLNSVEHILMHGKTDDWKTRFLSDEGFESKFFSEPGKYKPAKFIRESLSIEIVDSPGLSE